MDLTELKLVFASNLIRLRTDAGLTQAELGAALNYSDKSISKWERGEAIPDAYVLTQLSGMFGVTVDELLRAHDKWEAPEAAAREPEKSYSAGIIIAIVIVGIWTAALTGFVTLWLFDILWWKIFIIALPVSLLAYLVLICAFKRTKHLPLVIGVFVLSLFVFAYFMVPLENPWQLFLMAIPAEIIVFLSCNIRHKPKFLRKKEKN